MRMMEIFAAAKTCLNTSLTTSARESTPEK
jgi:hypothetical protein